MTPWQPQRTLSQTSAWVAALCSATLALGASCSRHSASARPGGFAQRDARAPELLQKEVSVEVVAQYHHDAGAFTQGLEVDQHNPDYLYESTGRFGYSSLRRVEFKSGRVLAEHRLEHSIFSEGLTQVGDELWQLSWRNQRLFRYDAQDLKSLGEFSYPGEGWGLCFDGQQMVMSDGSAQLQFRRKDDFSEISRVEVRDEGTALSQLNELECAQGRVYANVWHADWIAEIDPQDGRVLRRIDASILRTKMPQEVGGVLNGIAFRPSTATFLLTGKNWPSLFEVRIPGISPDSAETDPKHPNSGDSAPSDSALASQCQLSPAPGRSGLFLVAFALGLAWRRRTSI